MMNDDDIKNNNDYDDDYKNNNDYNNDYKNNNDILYLNDYDCKTNNIEI